jgi:hypothetical protein
MPNCSVQGCSSEADYEVIFYDVYLFPSDATVFHQRHEGTPYICHPHMAENETQAHSESDDKCTRRYRGMMEYPLTPSGGQGFVIYRPLR